MYPNVEEIINQIKSIVERHQMFSKSIMDALKPPAGPYALFHHHSHFIERLNDVSFVLERMGRARVRITILNERQAKLEPKRGVRSGKFPKYLQKIFSENHKLTGLMRLDNESLYIFGNLTLDQWAYTTAYSLGLANPEKYDFQYFITQLQAGTIDPKLNTIKDRHFKDAIWLYYQLRFYRNNFIEHVRRPWQRGSTMKSYGDDFNFFIPTPPGWIPDDEQKKMLNSIKHLAPDWTKKLPAGHWQAKPKAVLEASFKHIEDISSQQDREKIWNVWKELGGSVISFDVLGNRLVKFVQESTETLMTEIENSPQNINLGASPYKETV